MPPSRWRARRSATSRSMSPAAIPPRRPSASRWRSPATRWATATCAACSTRARSSTPRRTAALIHSIPVGYTIDGSRGIRDPRGMYRRAPGRRHACGHRGGRRRCATSPPASPAAISTSARWSSRPMPPGWRPGRRRDGSRRHASSTWAAAPRPLAVFFDGNVVYTDSIPIGGQHVTSDIARGLSTPLAHAERMKTLYGNCVALPGRRARA